MFGQWLTGHETGRVLRLVIEEMSEAASAPSAVNALLTTSPQLEPRVSFSSGSPRWPWRGEREDSEPAITWRFASQVDFLSLNVTQTDETEWIRRYRVEVSDDGEQWRVAVPSRVIDAAHRQPCALTNRIHELESSLLPSGRGTHWATSFFEDLVLKAIEPLGPDSPFPDWLSAQYFVATAVRPFYYGGVFNSIDAGNFNALLVSLFAPELALESQKLFPDIIRRYGYMPGVMIPGDKGDGCFSLDYSGNASGPCSFWDLQAWLQDEEFLGWFADANGKWVRWWLENRDRDGDGWLEPGVNSCKPSSPEFRRKKAKEYPVIAKLCPQFWDYVGQQSSHESAFLLSIYEMPWDDGPVFLRGRNVGLRFNPQTCSVNIHFIETQLHVSLIADFVASAYRRCGRAGEADYFSQAADRLRSLVADNCWDEESGFYYDCDCETGSRRTFVKHVGAFDAMLMGIPTMDQAKRMVEHLTSPREFWTDHPVPTVSRDSVDYSPNGYWSGRAWPSTNFVVLRALLNYGFFDEADELLRRWVGHVQTCVERPIQYFRMSEPEWYVEEDVRHTRLLDVRWISPENWNPENGTVHGSGGVVQGGLWLPAVIMRHFWPVGEHSVLLRPGGHFHLRWGDRWEVDVEENRAQVNGRNVRMTDRATYLMDTSTGSIRPLEPGRSEPAVLLR